MAGCTGDTSAYAQGMAQGAWNDQGIPIPPNSCWSISQEAWLDNDTGAVLSSLENPYGTSAGAIPGVTSSSGGSLLLVGGLVVVAGALVYYFARRR